MKNFVIATVLVISSIFSASGQEFGDYLTKANECFKKGDYECALNNYKSYQKASGTSGQDVSTLVSKSEECQKAKSIADEYLNGKDYQNAVAKYNRILQLNPDDSYAKNQRDFCLREINLSITPPITPLTEPSIIGGRKVSFGVSLGGVSTNFNTNFTGDNMGTAIDYKYATSNNKKPSYSSEIGWSAGIILDIRLVNNLYLQTGLNYVRNKVKYSFINSSLFTITDYTTTTYLQGTLNDNFEENYELNYLELPLLLSYRFKLSEKSNFQISAGPYIGYGLSGTCKVSGTTDWPTMTEYNTNTNVVTGRSFYENMTYEGVLDLFTNPGKTSSTTSYTFGQTGGGEPESDTYPTDYSFKNSPFQKLNAGISLGAGFEFSGFNIGFSYDFGLMNIANDDYWTSDRMNIANRTTTGTNIKGYQQKLNKLQFKIGYIFRW